MKPLVPSLIAIAGALALGACASGYGGVDYAGGYGAYYDDFYGPYYSGFWGPDDVFLFARTRGARFERDEARHFRHDGATGFHGVRTARAPSMPMPAAPRAMPPKPG
jgi:hypothetical protein